MLEIFDGYTNRRKINNASTKKKGFSMKLCMHRFIFILVAPSASKIVENQDCTELTAELRQQIPLESCLVLLENLKNY